MGMRKGGRPSLFPGSGDGSTLNLDFTTGVLDPRLTFSRASTATFVNSSGYVEYAGANLLLQGSNLGNATSWFGNGLTSRNASPDPNGSNEAVELNEDATNTVHVVIQITSQNFNGLVYTSTVYMKAGTNRTIGFMRDNNVSSDATVFYTLTGSGTATIANGAYGIVASINAVGGGWYRCVFTIKGAGTANVTIGTARGTAYGDWTFAGTVGNSIHVWGAQVNPGSTAQTYYPTTGTLYHAPRFDYSPTNIGEPRGLLIEGQSTNLSNSVELWGTSLTTISTVSSQLTPANDSAVYKVTDNATNGQHSINRTPIIGTAVSGAVYTASVWMKKPSTNAHSYAGFQIAFGAGGGVVTTFNLATGANTQSFAYGGAATPTYTSTAYSNSWFRYTMTFTFPGTGSANIYILLSNDGTTTSYAGTGTDFYVWGVQVEAGSSASSYIPTGASQVTRTVDTCYMSGISSWYNESAGTVISNLTYNGLATNNSGIELSVGTGTSATNRIGIRKTYVDYYSGGGSAQAEMYPTVTSGNVRIGTAYSLNDFAMCSNGGTMLADGSGAVPVGLNTLKLYADNGTSGLVINGLIKSIKYFPTRLSNAQLQALTTP